jgi:glycerophosphoryl diester phosphodiesterase
MNTAFIIVIVAAIILLLGLAALYMSAPGRVEKSGYAWLTGQDFAHRGLYAADQSIPENSLAAFSRAVREGFGIELDVELSSDDVLMVFHDNVLGRMTGSAVALWDCTFDELQRLRLAGSGEKIPTFLEVLKLVNGRVPLIVEIKTTGKLEKICAATYDLLRLYDGFYCIESFNPLIVAWFRRHAPEVLRGQLSMSYRNEKSVTGFKRFALENMLLNFLARPQFVAYRYEDRGRPAFRLCRMLGALTVAWTIRSEGARARAKRAFDAVIFENFIPARRGHVQGAAAAAARNIASPTRR